MFFTVKINAAVFVFRPYTLHAPYYSSSRPDYCVLRAGDRETAAADAVPLPLPVQPARPQPHLLRPLPDQPGAVHQDQADGALLEERVSAGVRRPAD